MVSFFQNVRNVIRIGAGIAAVAALAACEPMPNSGRVGPSAPSGPTSPVDIALLVPAGSGVDELEAIAASLESAARLAAADITGVQVNLTVYNTQRNTPTAVAAAQQAIASGADVILGPLDGEAAAAVGLAVASSGRSVLTFSNNTAVAGGGVYLLGQTFQDSARRLSSFAVSQGKTRPVVLNARTVAGEAGRSAVVNALTLNGTPPLAVVSYENTLPGISSAVGDVRRVVGEMGADSIVLTSSTSGALPILAELLPEAGVDPVTTQYLGLARWDLDSRLFSLTGAEGGWFTMPDRARGAAFEARFNAAYGTRPHPLAFTAYDGVAVIAALWAQGGSNPLSAEAITRPQGFQGSTGIVRFSRDGTNERGLAIGTIQAQQVLTISAAPQSFAVAAF
ncbi:MAG: penicillin-binding protein activator [Pseudomonadota bacterium]